MVSRQSRLVRSVSLALAMALAAAPGQALPQAAPPAAMDGAVARAWGFDKSDMQPDPAVRFGVLANGMRYAIMPNKTPAGTASIRMRFDIGSTAEADDQRGLAHFLEHMAFNGSRNVPEGEMVKLLERMGLAFGPDTNASTGFNDTTYMLELPKATKEYLDTGLKLMRETASELTIDPKAVDRERGVVLSEMSARENFGLRQFRDLVEFMVPGTAIAKGLPIGKAEVLKTAPASRIRDLYEGHYVPERATLIIVGDVEAAAVEADIKARFSDWKPKRPPAPKADLGKVDPARPSAVDTFIDPDVPTGVTLATAKPYVPEADTTALRRKRTIESLAFAIMNRRLARIGRQADGPFSNASASASPFFKTAQTAMLSVTAKDRNWKAALQAGEQELRRALMHGFTQAELDEQVAAMRTMLSNAAQQAGTRRNDALAMMLTGTLSESTVFTTPQSSLERFEKVVPGLTVQEVTMAFRQAWSGARPLVHVSHNAEIPGGHDTILAALRESASVAVAAPDGGTKKAFAYTDFGKPGTIAEDKRIADLDVRTIRFANNVRLNIKKTDFETGKVRVSLRVGGGLLEFPRTLEGGGLFFNSAFVAGGTKAHSTDELQSILAGKSVAPTIRAGGTAFGDSVTTTPADLQTQLQLFAAMITAPGLRPEGESQWRNLVGVILPTLDSQPGGVASRDVSRIVANDDPRFGIPGEAVLRSRTFNDIKPVIEKSFSTGPIEIAIVGDVSEEDAIKAVASTFGALPPRAADRPDYVGSNGVRFRVDRSPVTLTHGGKPDQSLALVYWPTTDDSDAREEQRLALLAQVIDNMLTDELRERMGATYSPNASSFNSEPYKGYGYLSASVTTDPGKIDAVYSAIDTIIEKLRKEPPSDDLILRARAPIIERIRKSQRDNGAWIDLIDEAQTSPRDLERFRTLEATVMSLTGAELRDAAARYLDPKGALRIRIVPRTAPAAGK